MRKETLTLFSLHPLPPRSCHGWTQPDGLSRYLEPRCVLRPATTVLKPRRPRLAQQKSRRDPGWLWWRGSLAGGFWMLFPGALSHLFTVPLRAGHELLHETFNV